MKIAIVVGHWYTRKGARNKRYPRLNEFDINFAMSKEIAGVLRSEGHAVKIIIARRLKQKVKKINKFHPHIQVSLHLNAFKGYNGNAEGYEVLIVEGDSDSRVLADILLEKFANIASVNRGVKPRSRHQRGHFILSATNAKIKVLGEPLFIDGTEGELMLDDANTYNLAMLYADGILEYIEGVIK